MRKRSWGVELNAPLVVVGHGNSNQAALAVVAATEGQCCGGNGGDGGKRPRYGEAG